MGKSIKANNKTAPHDGNVLQFIDSINHEGRREDALLLLELMGDITVEDPMLWGPSIVGFGTYHYVYESGREGDWMLTGFAPRKANTVVYIMPGFEDYETELENLGKHKHGKSCLYLGRLNRIDLDVLRSLITKSVQHIRETFS